jgi:hypothetical protein
MRAFCQGTGASSLRAAAKKKETNAITLYYFCPAGSLLATHIKGDASATIKTQGMSRSVSYLMNEKP